MWITLTRDDLLSALNAAEEGAYNLAVTGDVDPALEIIETAVNEARGHIADHPGNSLAAGLTIPERVKHHVLAIIRFRIMTRLDITVSDDRKTEYVDARRFLERVSEGKFGIERPEGAIDPQAGGASVEIVSSARQTVDREGLDRL